MPSQSSHTGQGPCRDPIAGTLGLRASLERKVPQKQRQELGGYFHGAPQGSPSRDGKAGRGAPTQVPSTPHGGGSWHLLRSRSWSWPRCRSWTGWLHHLALPLDHGRWGTGQGLGGQPTALPSTTGPLPVSPTGAVSGLRVALQEGSGARTSPSGTATADRRHREHTAPQPETPLPIPASGTGREHGRQTQDPATRPGQALPWLM